MIHDNSVFSWFKVTFVKWCEEEEKGEENGVIFRNIYLANYSANIFQIWYRRSRIWRAYINLIEIGPVVIEIRGVENGDLVVPVNNTLVCHMAFLAANTRPCVLITNV